MKDIVEKIEIIKSRFDNGGYKNLRDILLEVQISGGTPGENFAGISYNLNKIKQECPQAYQLSKEEIDQIIKYAKTINYI